MALWPSELSEQLSCNSAEASVRFTLGSVFFLTGPGVPAPVDGQPFFAFTPPCQVAHTALMRLSVPWDVDKATGGRRTHAYLAEADSGDDRGFFSLLS